MSLNCPVCSKTGLPDYKTQEVTCSQCNSNLRAYMLLNTISRPAIARSKPFLPISIVVLAISLLVIFFWSKLEGPKLEVPLNISQINSQKVDSSEYYKTEITTLRDSISKISQKNDFVIEYKIKNGDCLTNVAYNFFGDWSKYSKIASDNNLVKPYKLTIGQIIKIKIEAK